MKGIFALCAGDLKRLLKNALFYVMLGTLAVMVILIRFVLPENPSAQEHTLVSYNLPLPYDDILPLDSEQAVYDAVANDGAIGLIADGNAAIKVVHTGLSDRTIHALAAILFSTQRSDVALVSLSDNTEPVPWNLRMMPVFICCEALLAGFTLGGALLLDEKESGALRALRISPMGTARYLAARSLLFGALGTVYALLIAWLSAGFSFPVLPFVLLSFFSAVFFTLLGLAFTAFFREMGSWFFAVVLFLSAMLIPLFSYAIPIFSPAWIKLVPSYPMVFAYEAVLFSGRGSVWPSLLLIAAEAAAMYCLSYIIVKRVLLKGGAGA